MRKTIAATVVLGFAVSVMAASDDEFGGIVKVYNAKFTGQTLKVKEGAGRVTVNGVTEVSDKLAKDSVSVDGFIIEYEDYTSFLAVEKDDYEQGGAILTFAVPKMIDFQDLGSTGAGKLAVEGSETNALAVALQKGLSMEYCAIDLESADLQASVSANYKAQVQESGKGKILESLSMNSSGTGNGEIRVYTDEDETEYFIAGVAVKNARIKYNRNKSDEYSEIFLNASGGTNDAAGVNAVNTAVENAIEERLEKSGVEPLPSVDFELEYSAGDAN
ncbi:hypothetical protein [Pontiella sulfatireligans]|nr:hypothetical protein [Pontiella sulfatireligans]